MSEGLFIVFEGIEGCGKSTQIAEINTRLFQQGIYPMVTREPMSSAIKGLVMTKMTLTPAAETLLFLADRANHVAKHLLPALRLNRIVLCDRYIDSTMAYQCEGKGVNPAAVVRTMHAFDFNLQPDVTLWLNCPVQTALDRVQRRGKTDKMEQECLEFHQKIHNYYLERSRTDETFIQIDGSQEPLQVTQDCLKALRPYLISSCHL